MSERLYLDHNATSPLRPEVRDAMIEALEQGHNPSSVHAEGRHSKAMLERSRKTLADVISTPVESVIFTASGTEANNAGLFGLAHGDAGVRTIFVSATEHPAMLGGARRLAETSDVVHEIMPVLPDGTIDLAWLERRIADPDLGPFAVCAMLANNETGVIHPIKEIGPLVWPKGGYVVVDAVQGIGKMPVHFGDLGADLLTLGAHKIGGPVGAGALVAKTGIPLTALLRGGGQELGRRSGTENLAGIVGFAKTVELASPEDYAALAPIRDAMEDGLPDGVTVWGKGAQRLPNTSCFSAPGFAGETQVMALDLAGIALSAGSACSSGKVKKTGTLRAMGANDEQARSAVRVSLGWSTPADAASRFLAAWTNEYNRVTGKAA